MNFLHFFKNIFINHSKISPPYEKLTDSFADTLAIDFKRAATEVIYIELQKVEEKYLSSILRQSYFPIEALAFHPIGHTTAIELEEFFRVHSEIDPHFESNFFKNILQKEYRSNQGSLVILPKNINPLIQPNEASLDNFTNEEAYQITLRGNKKRFTASVKLGPPKQRMELNLDVKKFKKETSIFFGRSNSSPITSSFKLGNISTHTTKVLQEVMLAIQVFDANGQTSLIEVLPFIIGREEPTAGETLKKISINGMYLSRKQLIIFQLNDIVYAFVPNEAKLCAVINSNEILKNLQLIEIGTQEITLIFGQTPETNQITVDKNQPQLYPSITIRKINSSELIGNNKTPIPSVSK